MWMKYLKYGFRVMCCAILLIGHMEQLITGGVSGPSVQELPWVKRMNFSKFSQLLRCDGRFL